MYQKISFRIRMDHTAIADTRATRSGQRLVGGAYGRMAKPVALTAYTHTHTHTHTHIAGSSTCTPHSICPSPYAHNRD